MPDCVFCKNLPKVMENDLAYVLFDINPVSQGHSLVVLKRHVEAAFDVTPEEFLAIKDLLDRMKTRLDQECAPDGYNIWINCGKPAGQVVMHAHVHLVPRFKGQVLHIKEHLKGNIE